MNWYRPRMYVQNLDTYKRSNIDERQRIVPDIRTSYIYLCTCKIEFRITRELHLMHTLPTSSCTITQFTVHRSQSLKPWQWNTNHCFTQQSHRITHHKTWLTKMYCYCYFAINLSWQTLSVAACAAYLHLQPQPQPYRLHIRELHTYM